MLNRRLDAPNRVRCERNPLAQHVVDVNTVAKGQSAVDGSTEVLEVPTDVVHQVREFSLCLLREEECSDSHTTLAALFSKQGRNFEIMKVSVLDTCSIFHRILV